MESSVNKLEKSQLEVIVEVDGQKWEDAQKKAFKKALKDLEVDGFRKGQVPESVAKTHIKNEAVLVGAVDEVAQDALIDAIEKHNIELVASPELAVEAISDTAVKLKFICTVKPEVTLGEYKQLGLEEAEVSVSNSEVEEQLEAMKENYAELVVKEAAIVEGDTAVFDFKGLKDGVAFEGGTAENFSLEIGSGQFIPGFEEQLVGLKAGDEKALDLSFPEDYHVEELKGQPVVFEVLIHEVKERVVPELNDDFALDTGIENVENLEDLKAHISDDILENKKAEAAREYENELLSKVVDASEVEIPEIMVEDETNRLYEDMKMRIESQGIPFDQFIMMTGQDEEGLRENIKQDAYQQVKLRLVLDKVSEVEDIQVLDEQIEEEYKNLAEIYNMEVDEIKNAIDQVNIAYDLKLRKAYDLIKELN